ncbi:MAG: type II toxin-antitoxin system RatA family toxin [Mariprofundaceae bacterium]
MRSFEESRIIACPARQMYDIVLDIDAYAEFLPWVAESRVLSQTDGELTAELVADLAGVKHAFKTVDRYVAGKLVEIRLLEGPFRFLESVWTFDDQDDGRCKVHFSIEFEFRSMMMDMIASPVFATACKSMVHAFEERAVAMLER